MINVQLLNKISNIGTDIFDKDKYAFTEDMKNPEAILVRSAKMHDMKFEENLVCIARAGVGVNTIPLDECAKQGIVVFNTPGANANAVKELIISSLILSSRNVAQGIEWCKTLKDKGADVEALVEKGKSQFVGPEIKGKKLGIIGLGAIGGMVANAAKNLGLEVYGFDPYLSIKGAWALSRGVKNAKSMKEIFETCDYITLHIPLNGETKYTINKETIAVMKDNVIILNFSRGDLVCDDDIIDALETGKVASYVTDFPNAKLLSCDKVISIPHLGASTPESEENCARMAVEQVIEFMENGNIINSVNYPNLEIAREAKTRLCVANKNTPSIVGVLSTILGDANINIENMTSRSKGDYAYTIIETNSEIPDEIMAIMNAHDGIIKTRVIK